MGGASREAASPEEGEDPGSPVFQTLRVRSPSPSPGAQPCHTLLRSLTGGEPERTVRLTPWKTGCLASAQTHIPHLVLSLFQRISQGWFFNRVLGFGGGRGVHPLSGHIAHSLLRTACAKSLVPELNQLIIKIITKVHFCCG